MSADLDKPVAEDRPDMVLSMERFVKDSEAECLNLERKRLTTSEAKVIFQYLPHSSIRELNLNENSLLEAAGSLIGVLDKTKVKKLKISKCSLSEKEIVNLMTGLSNTEITELDVSCNDLLMEENLVNELVNHLAKSSLVQLNLDGNVFSCENSAIHFLDALPNTSLISLSLMGSIPASKMPNLITKLFQNLSKTVIKHLYLANNEISSTHLSQIANNLRNSALEDLDLSHNNIFDEGVDFLLAGLVGSKVHKLTLKNCKIAGSNSLGDCLKSTQLKTLDLSCNKIKHRKMFSFPTFLQSSSVTKISLQNCKLSNDIGKQLMKSFRLAELTDLDVSCNNFRLGTVSEFIAVVNDTEITNVDFGGNDIPCSSVIALGESLNRSKLQEVNFSNNAPTKQLSHAFAKFIEKTKGTSVTLVNLSFNEMNSDDMKVMAPNIAKTTFTHFNLMSNPIGEGVRSLTSVLRLTAITHLNLSNTDIKDEGVKIVAECLKDTQIVDLDISSNGITCCGAKALAQTFKDSKLLHVNLKENKIGNDGIVSLAKNVESTFITSIDMAGNPGNKDYLIDEAVWKTQKLARRLINFFKKIAPVSDDNVLRLTCVTDDSNIENSLENCLYFYKTFTKQPQALHVLTGDQSICLSKSQILTLMRDEFPKQFSAIIESKLEEDITLHRKFLKKATELELEKVEEHLLQIQPASEAAKEQKKKERKKKACGLCGKTKHLLKTACCNNWVCDDQHKYVMFSYARNSCHRNHDRYTLCAYHHTEGHPGKWETCRTCKNEFDDQMYTEYTRHDYNFVKLENAPKSSIMGAVKTGAFQTVFLP